MTTAQLDLILQAITFAVIAPTLYAAHAVADHWVQNHGAACGKAARGWSGRAWCAWHVVTYLVTCLVAMLAVLAVFGLLDQVSTVGLAVGSLVNGVSHYIVDRRRPLIWLARVTGHGGWIEADPKEAPYKLDQSWHTGWLLVTAVITAAWG
jgi:hypothetical protein